MSVSNTVGMKNMFYIRRVMKKQSNKIVNRLPLIDYHDRVIKKEQEEKQNDNS